MEIDWDNPNLIIGDNYQANQQQHNQHYRVEVPQLSFDNASTTSNELAQSSFMHWLQYFENLPDLTLKHYRVKPTVLEASALLEAARDLYQGTTAWLFDELYNFESNPSSRLTDTDWKYYRPYALVSKAKLLLCRETLRWYSRNSNKLKSWSPLEVVGSAGHFWFLCEATNFLWFVYQTNLGKCLRISELSNDSDIAGKDELYREYQKESDLREDSGLEVESILFSELKVPCFTSVLITEARKIACKDEQVETLLQNYWGANTHLFSQVRKDDAYQITQLTQDGLTWRLQRGGKGRKLSKSKGFTPSKRSKLNRKKY